MSSISKFKKNNDGVASMFLVPKRMYESLLDLLDYEDEETRNEIIALNQNQINSNNNYIENAIRYRNLQNLQRNISRRPNFVNSNVSRENVSTTQDYQLPTSLLQQQTTDYSSPFSNLAKSDFNSISEMITSVDRQPNNESEVGGATAVETSTPLRPPQDEQYRNSPIYRAINETNEFGKRVCPFDYCKKEFRDVPELAKHMFKAHATEMGDRQRQILKYSQESIPIKTPKKTISKKSGGKNSEKNDTPLKRPGTRAQAEKDSSKNTRKNGSTD